MVKIITQITLKQKQTGLARNVFLLSIISDNEPSPEIIWAPSGSVLPYGPVVVIHHILLVVHLVGYLVEVQ